jgi:hypothetical protein
MESPISVPSHMVSHPTGQWAPPRGSIFQDDAKAVTPSPHSKKTEPGAATFRLLRPETRVGTRGYKLGSRVCCSRIF